MTPDGIPTSPDEIVGISFNHPKPCQVCKVPTHNGKMPRTNFSAIEMHCAAHEAEAVAALLDVANWTRSTSDCHGGP